MRIAKWIFGVCLTAVFVFGGKVDVRAEDYVTEDGLQYGYQPDGSIKIWTYQGESETVEIPSQIDGKPVTTVCDSVWRGGEWHQNPIRHLIVPEGVVKIEDAPWIGGRDGWNLESVTLPSTLEIIGSGAFSETGIKEIKLPVGLAEIRKQAFWGCEYLKKVEWTDGLERLRKTVPHGGDEFEKAAVQEGLKIGNEAFRGCYVLESFIFPKGVASIGERAFAYTDLKEAVLSEGLESIGNEAFTGCDSLTEAVLPAGLKSIGEEAFLGCKVLKETVLPDGLESIGARAFAGCESLESVTVPDSVASIGVRAFFRKEVNRKEVYILVRANPDSYARRYADENGIPFSCVSHSRARAFPAVPATCETDGRTAGRRCEECGSVLSGMTAVPKKGHRTAWATVERTCTRDGTSYSYCTVCGKKGVCRRDKASGHRYKISVNRQSRKKVYTCGVCGYVKNPEDAEPRKNQVVEEGDGASYKVAKIEKKGGTVEFREADPGASSVEVPDSIKIGGATYRVTSIAKDAFRGNKKLKKVTIGRNVTKIQAGAFGGCRNLKTITVRSKGIKTVGKNAFKGIQAKAKIKVPASKYGKYKKLFRKKGQKSTVKIIKS